MKKKYFWWALAGIGGAAALGAVLWGPIASQVERARYKRVARDRDIEIRDYTPLIVAETAVSRRPGDGDTTGLSHARRLHLRQQHRDAASSR